MNPEHRAYCASARWAEILQEEILPWALGDRDLGDDLLEVGAGPGMSTDVLRQLVPRLTAVELDDRLAAALAARLAGTNVEVVHADATALPLESGRFSAVTCFTMLHHVPSAESQDQLLGELRRVLRPGGLLVGSDSVATPELREFHEGDTYVPIDPDTMAARLRQVGFMDVEVQSSHPPAERFRFLAHRPPERGGLDG
ncbi:class I SAM-dependent methyltransferase [soil metagenome]